MKEVTMSLWDNYSEYEVQSLPLGYFRWKDSVSYFAAGHFSGDIE